MSKPILISGIQPSGRLHIGNYLGALKNFVDLQNSGKYQCFYFVADLHSLTEPNGKTENTERAQSLMVDYLAAGLNPKHSTLFVQSSVLEHANLAWLLSTVTPFSELSRMTQFKDKAQQQKESANVGLFFYPELMAADILLYDAKFVPVGEDQTQHLELARTLARKFNAKYGKLFIEPQPLFTKTPRIMSLDDPHKKMSKSRPEGCLFIDDTPSEIKRKIKRAVTDSGSEIKYNPKNKPGISNMLMIMSGLSGKSLSAVEKVFSGMNYGELKNSLTNYVTDYFEKFRKEKNKLSKKYIRVKSAFSTGNRKMAKIAFNKFQSIKAKIGLIS